jgi:microcystin-dependent protein/cytoskeletal protein CcmA (bactofilin family)
MGKHFIVENSDNSNTSHAQIYNDAGKLNIYAGQTIVSNNTHVGGDFSISGTAHFQDISVSGTMVVDGAVTMNNDVHIGPQMNISGPSDVSVSISGVVSVDGAVTMNNDVHVGGKLTTSGTMVVSGAVTMNSSLQVGGALNVTGAIKKSGYELVPIGCIMIWYGTLLNVPGGWALCDGGTYNGVLTPDLRGRFVLGAGQGAGLTNRVPGATGGEETHTLTTAEMPGHTHTGTTASAGDHAHTYNDAYFAENTGGSGTLYGTSAGTDNDNDYIWRTSNGSTDIPTSTAGAHTHTFTTNSTGSGGAHNTMPPFYVLAYIMKVL